MKEETIQFSNTLHFAVRKLFHVKLHLPSLNPKVVQWLDAIALFYLPNSDVSVDGGQKEENLCPDKTET